ncbi:MAG TPA: oxidoreductase [Candidatus Andersenbacteria bacterium]|nr:oxidoreductase [Candidatus Andersenbacteria bacterium]
MPFALRLGDITMYRLMLYFLLALLATAVMLSAAGSLPYRAMDILGQAVAFVALCWVANTIIARVGKIPANFESPLITGLILSAIVGPLVLPRQWVVLVALSVAAMAAKYILVWQRSHVFNPAAVAVVAAALVLGVPASWWIGSAPIGLFILLGGVVVLQKIKRWGMVGSFLGVYLGLLALQGIGPAGLGRLLIASPLLFFSVVMLVEPLTAPRTRARRVAYGAVVGGGLWLLQRTLPVPYTLELALLAGNTFAVLLQRNWRQRFVLKRNEVLSPSIKSWWFAPQRPFAFQPGQFLEYTLGGLADARGQRRYFTIASSPTEREVLLTSRVSHPGSVFKQRLTDLPVGGQIIAGSVSGDFVLPKDAAKKLAFIAGGIGVTPFRSMAKYTLDVGERRDVVLLYGARAEEDFVFQDVFAQAQQVGWRIVYQAGSPIDERLIRTHVPDFGARMFYVSGSTAMVQAVTQALRRAGVAWRQIKRDDFPGYGA